MGELSPEKVAAGFLAVPGFRAGAVSAGLKPSGAPDVTVVVASEARPASAVFTTNATAAAPVHRARAVLQQNGTVQSFVVNSGNANALTGPRGDEDALAMEERLKDRCGGPALVFSTGVIGVPLPMTKVLDGIDRAAEALTPAGGPAFAEAILTTDTVTKTAVLELELPAEGDAPAQMITLGGTAKGSGMIHPDMATMLAYMATDAPVTSAVLDEILRGVVDQSFHAITVDGDTSTNDAVLLVGAPGDDDHPPITGPGSRYEALRAGILELAQRLATQIVEDGEGATRWMVLTVDGAFDRAAALKVARTVATSALVKTALAGGDPNWGRILGAAGRAGVPFDVADLRLELGDLVVFAGGAPVAFDKAAADTVFQRRRVEVRLTIGEGAGRATVTTTDLTRRYVEINSLYTT